MSLWSAIVMHYYLCEYARNAWYVCKIANIVATIMYMQPLHHVNNQLLLQTRAIPYNQKIVVHAVAVNPIRLVDQALELNSI